MIFLIVPAYAETFDEVLSMAKKDGCINKEEVKQLEMHPENGAIAIRQLSLQEVKLGTDFLDFDLNGPKDDLTIYASFYPQKVGHVRLIAFNSTGCFVGMTDIPSFIAAMFLDRMALV